MILLHEAMLLSSSTKFLAKGAHIKLARQRCLREVMLLPPPPPKGNVSKVFQRIIKFLAKGAHIKLKKRKVYDSNGEQSLSAVSSSRSILQWKNVTLQFRRFSVGGKISRNFSSSVTVGSKIPRNFSSSAASGGNEAYPGGQILPTLNLRVFSFSELKTATRNFRVNTMLGEGGFGKVYKGWLKEKATSKNGRGSAVAIKKLDTESMQGFDEWQSEVHFIGRLSHPNLVKLLGYCWENNELLLVYEFMQKGSLENHLFGRGSAVHPLPWDIRLKILIGAAQGLTFLHTSEEQVMYRDFKAANILLDRCYNAKISGFGLAKLGPSSKSHIVTRVMGSSGYAAPEYVATGQLYLKSDVYGFGVVLIEMLTGLRAVDLNRPYGRLNLFDWIKPYLSDGWKLKQVMDSQLQGKYPSKAALQIAQLALKCIEREKKTRSSMKVVVETLQHLVENDEKPKEPRVHPRNRTSSHHPCCPQQPLHHRSPLHPRHHDHQSYQFPPPAR
ncbi:probable serine/threonine-protein kinase PIX13 [Rhododendron vialii]|uniref:probable serine/threonine-protein kinase PIX13 n=1 Tax=Rhododendron vialii TaxID=182163 RepID=UPI00265ED042|nr:probable serine/threonine-protein kinase PIX13 [Rhododendron vialii]